MCPRMCSSLSSRNLVFNNNTKTNTFAGMFCGQMVGTLHLCIGTWADGWNVTPVYWYAGRWKERYTCVLVCGQMEGTVHLLFFGFLVGSRDDGNAPVERMRSERHSCSAL